MCESRCLLALIFVHLSNAVVFDIAGYHDRRYWPNWTEIFTRSAPDAPLLVDRDIFASILFLDNVYGSGWAVT